VPTIAVAAAVLLFPVIGLWDGVTEGFLCGVGALLALHQMYGDRRLIALSAGSVVVAFALLELGARTFLGPPPAYPIGDGPHLLLANVLRGLPLVVGGRSSGARVACRTAVTLGAVSFPRDAAGNIIRGMKRHPTLQDEVVVYANATILGGDTVVGHHAVVGSNVWLTHSVDPYTAVLLEKPQLRIKGPENYNI
jgi:acetyltransferase-like isoleucine patch superfamily enzyme